MQICDREHYSDINNTLRGRNVLLQSTSPKTQVRVFTSTSKYFDKDDSQSKCRHVNKMYTHTYTYIYIFKIITSCIRQHNHLKYRCYLLIRVGYGIKKSKPSSIVAFMIILTHFFFSSARTLDWSSAIFWACIRTEISSSRVLNACDKRLSVLGKIYDCKFQ